MSQHRQSIVKDLRTLLDRLLERHRRKLRDGERISAAARENVEGLVISVGDFCAREPFPEPEAVDTDGLATLRELIDAENEDPNAIQKKVEDWLHGGNLPTATVTASRPIPAPTPINERMLGHLKELKRTLRSVRGRLNGDYDQEAYKRARNDFNYAYEVYRQKLLLNQLRATNEEAAVLQKEIIPGLGTSTDATFVDRIEFTASFLRKLGLPLA